MSTITETHYEELVRAGREAREQADSVQWVEGDLALQIEALPADERPRDPETGAFIADAEKVLKRYADDIEVGYRWLREYRRTSEAWPHDQRALDVGWRTHQVLAAQEDRFTLIRSGMTTREAAKIVRDRSEKANYGGEPSWHELLGQVGDDLIKAQKDLAKVEKAINREPNKAFRVKAGKYADWAEEVGARLRNIEAA